MQQLVWIAGTGYGLASSGTQEWSASLLTLPTVTAPDGSAITPDLGAAIVLVPTSSGVARLDGATGKITKEYPVPPPAANGQAFPVGNGILVAGSATETVYWPGKLTTGAGPVALNPSGPLQE